MRRGWYLAGMGVLFSSLIAVQLARFGDPQAGASPTSTIVHSSELSDNLRSPARAALREAACWIAKARQTASDEADEMSLTLQTWDPKAGCTSEEMYQQQLARDSHGYLERARAAIRRAEKLSRTPQEKRWTAQQRALWLTNTDEGQSFD